MEYENVESGVLNDNVVGRLYNIIYFLVNNNFNGSVQIFKNALGNRLFENFDLPKNYTEILNMCLQGKEEIRILHPKNMEKYFHTLNKVHIGLANIRFYEDTTNNYILHVDLKNNSSFKDYFDGVMMGQLETCADFLSNNAEEKEVEQEQIDDLIKEVNSLIEKIATSEIDIELEEILYSQLLQILDSLKTYKLYGVNNLKNKLSQTMGTLLLNQHKIKTEKAKSVVESICKLVKKIGSVIAVVNSVAQLVENVTMYLK